MTYELDDDQIRDYFTESAEDWVNAGYNPNDLRVYPTPLHRARVVCSLLESKPVPSRLADLGCGGGNLAVALAERGHSVDGFDRSAEMLRLAGNLAKRKNPSVASRLTWTEADISEDMQVEAQRYDGIVSMGVIGYLSSDEILFRIARRGLKPNGLLIVSCRNRLFNMVSLSDRTRREIKSGAAMDLIDEIERLRETITPAQIEEFLRALEGATGVARKIVGQTTTHEDEKVDPLVEGQMAFEPSQQTPEGMAHIAREYGFEVVRNVGIHPHLMDPRLNGLMPAGVFNSLSRAAERLESTPQALIWSSVFIGVYRMTDGR